MPVTAQNVASSSFPPVSIEFMHNHAVPTTHNFPIVVHIECCRGQGFRQLPILQIDINESLRFWQLDCKKVSCRSFRDDQAACLQRWMVRDAGTDLKGKFA